MTRHILPLILSTLAMVGTVHAAPAVTATPATLHQAGATATIGQTAPDFTATGVDGTAFRLSEQTGKIVVLEWFNPGCPFVKAAHGEGPLKALPKQWQDKDVVWVAVNSGAPGKQGTGVETNRDAAAGWSMNYPVLLDETGVVGSAYGAKTTPQVVIVDKAGKVAFNGALDNAPLGKVDGGNNQAYVDQALQAVAAGTAIAEPSPKPYGCSVKYGS
jgi:alkyl hydroperoxide reductase subunit AhpC